MHARFFNRSAKFAPQHFVYAGTHKVNNFLWCIHYAVCICTFNRITLEEAFVDRIKEVLPFQPAIDTPHRSLYRYIKAVKRLEELVSIERAASERINHFLNLGGNGNYTTNYYYDNVTISSLSPAKGAWS